MIGYADNPGSANKKVIVAGRCRALLNAVRHGLLHRRAHQRFRHGGDGRFQLAAGHGLRTIPSLPSDWQARTGKGEPFLVYGRFDREVHLGLLLAVRCHGKLPQSIKDGSCPIRPCRNPRWDSCLYVRVSPRRPSEPDLCTGGFLSHEPTRRALRLPYWSEHDRWKAPTRTFGKATLQSSCTIVVMGLVLSHTSPPVVYNTLLSLSGQSAAYNITSRRDLCETDLSC